MYQVKKKEENIFLNDLFVQYVKKEKKMEKKYRIKNPRKSDTPFCIQTLF